MVRRILVIRGTRPEAIKLAPVIYVLRGKKHVAETRVCLTGQHREMLYPVIEHFEIIPDYDLKLMKRGQTLSGLTAALISSLDTLLEDFKPHMIVVQGDTTTAFAGGFAGYYKQIQVGYVEAELRIANNLPLSPRRSTVGS